jgi:glycosyltransferase involved in cell wall biosynthesis
MRVFVSASVSEGLPNAMLEAAAAGVPIVATAIDGNRDVLSHRRSALLVPPSDVRSLTRAMQEILSSGALSDRLSAGASALAGRLSPQHEKRAWLRLYARLLSD